MPRRPAAALIVGVLGGLLIAGGTGWALSPALSLSALPSERIVVAESDPASATATETASAPAPTAPHPADDTPYDLASLPLIDVRSVNPAVPVDDDPTGVLSSSLARPLGSGAPVFAEPGGTPVGHLPRTHHYGGTTVPVVTAEEHWVKVLLPGRQGVPPQGDGGQTVGWLRVSDVEITPTESYVEVRLSANTIDIVTAAGRERVSDQFAWGKPATPTPSGRTFIMWTTVVPEFRYTEGHPVVYLGIQSPVMAGFDGGDVAVTAFHYYRQREGDTSFGCIYLDGPATDRLAQLAAGTPVIIHP
ncbi:L,D-transpeptidase [Microbacterium radiodurans]|uniref:Murein L,D-transpeptidase n=1 Tax=Microbacterium radiodurans TaxID=661398 RepID=A0A5J5IRD3_9MICO|nr:L,D-transpeptidase [Microbacterium radiodurans]KAA9087206.1 murein L,D-transpeptidase [Microbacterium radiodurans]